MGAFEETVDQEFTSKKARQELERYRRKGAGPTARLLIDGLVQAGIVEGSLLDVGGGIGALTFELLDWGIRQAMIVEASAAYSAAASDEAARRGRTNTIELRRGDFVEVATTLPAASIVTLDRVVCCYPLYEQLLSEAVSHAERGFAFSYPRDRWYVRAGMRLENALRRRFRNTFRTFVHPETKMRELITRAGFDLVSQRRTFVWSSDVFVRRERVLGGRAVPTIVPVTRQNSASRANASQLARSVKWKRVKGLRGKSKMSERRISFGKPAPLGRLTDEPVAEIVQCGEPAFLRSIKSNTYEIDGRLVS